MNRCKKYHITLIIQTVICSLLWFQLISLLNSHINTHILTQFLKVITYRLPDAADLQHLSYHEILFITYDIYPMTIFFTLNLLQLDSFMTFHFTMNKIKEEFPPSCEIVLCLLRHSVYQAHCRIQLKKKSWLCSTFARIYNALMHTTTMNGSILVWAKGTHHLKMPNQSWLMSMICTFSRQTYIFNLYIVFNSRK